jgi:undecaprenyl-diphosphatase
MRLLSVAILAIVQGLAELLPISSSAHVVVAENLMGIDPSLPETTLLLVMLHTGTMVAVIVCFWNQWRRAFFRSVTTFKTSALHLLLASAVTAVVGELLVKAIERLWFHNAPNAEIEQLFSHLELIAPALALVGVLILIAGIFDRQDSPSQTIVGPRLKVRQAVLIGAVQGLACPFEDFPAPVQQYRWVSLRVCRKCSPSS